MARSLDKLPGVSPSPLIQDAPDAYELHNRALDPEGRILDAIGDVRSWDDAVVLDLGAGTGYHVPTFAAAAQHVIAVEPHGPSRVAAMARVGGLGLENVSVMHGSAVKLLLPGRSVDLIHARNAYFFPPSCTPGITELSRVARRGGAACIVVDHITRGTYAGWVARLAGGRERDRQRETDLFWEAYGFARTEIETALRFDSRTDLESVVRATFGEHAEACLDQVDGLSVDYCALLYHKTY